MRFISLILLFLLSGTVSAQKVEWYATTQTSPWVKQKDSTLTVDYGDRRLLQ